MSAREHKKSAPLKVKVGVISISSSRSITEDQSGIWISKQVRKEGHELVLHRVIPDDRELIAATVHEVRQEYSPDILLLTGGTGISPADVTIEALRPLFDKELTAFATLFAQLSFEQVDSAAILSRATAGVIAQTVVFCMPGSMKACKLACNELIFPELGHAVRHVTVG